MNELNDPIAAALTIALAAGVTYLLRFGGLMAAARFPRSGRFQRFMDVLPGTILLSLIVPGIASAGIIGWVGAFCTAACTWKTGNAFLSMLFGVALVALYRQAGL